MHIILEDLNIVKSKKLCQLIEKSPKYQELKQISFAEALEEIQLCFDQLTQNGMVK